MLREESKHHQPQPTYSLPLSEMALLNVHHGVSLDRHTAAVLSD